MKNKKDIAFNDLKEKILTGTFPPGKWITEREVGEMYNISRTPVREVLWNLCNLYILETHAEHGYQVKKFSLEDIIELYNARQAIEGTCARFACSSADADYIPRLIKIREELELLDAVKNPEEGDLIGNKVHEFVIEKARNSYLTDFSNKFSSLSIMMRNVVKVYSNIEKTARIQHIEIIDALLARDCNRSERAMINHLQTTCKDTVSNCCNYLLGGRL